MTVGLLASRVALSPKLVNSLIRSIAEVAREDAKESTDLQWFRTSFMALVNLVQVMFWIVFNFSSFTPMSTLFFSLVVEFCRLSVIDLLDLELVDSCVCFPTMKTDPKKLCFPLSILAFLSAS